MINAVIAKVFGTANDRALKRILPIVQQVNSHEAALQSLTDEQLRDKTAEFRQRVAAAIEGIDPREDADALYAAEKAALDALLPEAFAVVREAGKRVVGMRHFDVQLIGGTILHQGKIAEMKTGEGKTLVATLPTYLNALASRGVHVVTVNDYLAKRDAEWMGKIYGFLGLTVGVIVHDLSDEQRRAAYASDITYGTNNEFGFDYLRDNMKFELSDMVQRGQYYCVVDEVDSILIDEARTPLIISGPTDQTTDKYVRVNVIIPELVLGELTETVDSKVYTGDFVIDEKARATTVTDEGWEKIEKLLEIGNIADPENWDLKHHVEVAIKAHHLYKRDVEYVVKDGEVIIVDEFTGRLMPGRRWSDGLHQSVEAKEGVNIRKEDQTLATITFQNYFRMYKKLSGMTGTAETEAAEFDKIYKLDIVVTPTNRQMLRIENPDVVFRTTKEKYFAVADEISRLHDLRQPVLVGTTSIEKSELLSDILKKKGVRHVVLNAKFHEKEAEIVAQAGRLGMVTIATNMAGRGTDILLGGNSDFMARQDLVRKQQARAVSAAEGAIQPVAGPGMFRFYYNNQEFECSQEAWDGAVASHEAAAKAEHQEVLAAGGLHILGTERHESRRVDNQLRGRAGRQGDPGASRFYLSLEDDLMRIFAREWVSSLLERLGMEEGVPIESGMISRRIEAAQKAVETQNFESRKHVLEYDDVMNKQREAVYGLRKQLMEGVDQKQLITEDYTSTIMSNILDETAPEKAHPDEWKSEALFDQIYDIFGARFTNGTDTPTALDLTTLSRHELGESIFDRLRARYDIKEQILGATAMRYHERIVMLSVLDGLWKDHLLAMDHLKEGIGLRGYAQQDPLVAYKKESFDMFEAMMMRFQEDTARHLFRMQIIGPDGQPIESAEQLAAAQAAQQQPPTIEGQLPELEAPRPTIPTKAPATTIDALEREFQKRKERELEQSRQASASATADESNTQRIAGERVGRNDKCPCGSGKKFKNCHGANA
ncbi:preprotein translocase subunit SecA [Granulicella tundricola]|uniref:Protein translocase subunit SecA n=1 Tax=Granulicella tundricola (strain ATCC BAA-1859 / DSM 23138 / MP5ACTX9) TaxID=1198114 RepID=E8WYT1_GRATM|nr:preprotein translocase subunit SecA [Granulicella tundricola]ADW68767.1 preprotein translocase, SecA subunit [Granulicella tundricola MP5ACTX9]